MQWFFLHCFVHFIHLLCCWFRCRLDIKMAYLVTCIQTLSNSTHNNILLQNWLNNEKKKKYWNTTGNMKINKCWSRLSCPGEFSSRLQWQWLKFIFILSIFTYLFWQTKYIICHLRAAMQRKSMFDYVIGPISDSDFHSIAFMRTYAPDYIALNRWGLLVSTIHIVFSKSSEELTAGKFVQHTSNASSMQLYFW